MGRIFSIVYKALFYYKELEDLKEVIYKESSWNTVGT